jgi:hypothetical protein
MYNNIIKWIFSILIILILSGVAHSKTDLEIENAIQTELMNRHPSDNGEFWTELGANAPDIIIQKYLKSDNPYHRTRLLAGLGFFPDNSRAVDFLKEQAESTNEVIIRNSAIRSIAYSQGVNELEFLSRFLKSDDAQTRLATAQALQKIKNPRARALIDGLMQSENNPWIKDQLQKSLPPMKTLSIVSSNTDALSPQFNGKWKGFFIIPGPGKVGLKSKPVVIELTVENGRNVQGQIQWTKKNSTESISFSKLEGKSNKLSGQIQYYSNNILQKLDFEAELFDKGQMAVIKGDLKSVNGGLIAQKDSD